MVRQLFLKSVCIFVCCVCVFSDLMLVLVEISWWMIGVMGRILNKVVWL